MVDLLLLDAKTCAYVEENSPDEKTLRKLGSFFSVFSDVTRLRIMFALGFSDMCVTDLATVLNLNQTTVSHQLKLLRDLDIVRTKRQGKIIFYYIESGEIEKIVYSGMDFLGI